MVLGTFSDLSYPLIADLECIIRDTIIPTTPLTNNNNDTIFWTITSNGAFFTASCYNSLLNLDFNIDFNLNWLWKLNAPKNLAFLVMLT